MASLGSHPGAIIFRLSVMIILIAILMAVFFSYLDDTEREFERSRIEQTRRVIDSALAVAFAELAVSGKLDALNELQGGNPFVLLEKLKISVPGYSGVIDRDLAESDSAGWYYLSNRGLVAYNSKFAGADRFYVLRMEYDDINSSGVFESRVDRFRHLHFESVQNQ